VIDDEELPRAIGFLQLQPELFFKRVENVGTPRAGLSRQPHRSTPGAPRRLTELLVRRGDRRKIEAVESLDTALIN
jgi:hypothetical protein